MNKSNSDYLRYKKMANVICSYDINLSEDLLQDTLLNFIEKGIDLDQIDDNYLFISLKNRFINIKTRGKKFYDLDMENLSIIDDIDDDRLDIENNNLDKLLSIKKNISLLDNNEKQLFTLVLIKDIKQVEVSRRTNLGKSLINMRLKKIKEKLRNGKI